MLVRVFFRCGASTRLSCLCFIAVLLLVLEGSALAKVLTISVLPFDNRSRTQGLQWMSESFPELFEERLKWPTLNILGREERLMGFDRIGIPYTSSLSKASLIKIGQEVDADVLLMGEFDSDGKQITVSVSTLNLRNNFLRPTLTETDALESFQLVCGRLAWRLLAQMDPTFPLSLQDYLARFTVIPNLALENYVRGLVESDPSKQIRFFRQAEKIYPNYAKAIFHLGKIYHQQTDYTTSSLWLQRLLRLDNDAPEARFILGLNYLYLKNYDQAAIEFQRLSRVMPLGEVYENLGIALSLSGSKEPAATALKTAAEGDPLNGDYRFNLGFHLWKAGDFGQALKSFAKASELNDDDGEAHYLQFKCYRALGDAEAAGSAWEVARSLAPKVEAWEGRRQMPDLFRIHSKFDGSSFQQIQLQIRQIQESKAGGLSSSDTVLDDISKAGQWLSIGRLDDAERLVAGVIQRSPESADAHLVMARILDRKGQKAEAVAELRASVWLRDSAMARVLLSRLYLDLDQRSKATEQAREALKLDPGNSDAKDLLARASEP